MTARPAWWIAAVVAGLVVFVAHCRPWEVGLLEEWGFADSWNHHGWSALSAVELGRPLQNLVVFLALTPGFGILGIQILLGLTAVGQYLILLRFAPHSEPSRRWLALIVALIVALHPLWPAGFILRFMAAQIAILGALGALALLYRYLRGGRAWLLLPVAVLIVAALFTYQGPAAVVPLIALALGFMLPAVPTRRRVLAPVVTAGTVVLTALWSTVIASKLAPSGATYESSLLSVSGGGGAVQTIKTLLHSIAHIPLTLATRAPATVVVVVVLFILVVALRRRFGLTGRVTWTLAAVTLLALFASIPYAANPIHVLDPERVGGPAALTLGLVLLLWVLSSADEAVRLQTGIVAALLIATGVATAISLTYYGRFAAIQRSMLEIVAPAARQATGRQKVLIEDGSGVLGDVYTGYSADLSASSHIYNRDSTDVEMCTVDGVARHHPVAAVYPLTTTEYCSALDLPSPVHEVSRGKIEGGPVTAYVVGRP